MLRFGKLLIRKVPRERGVLTRDRYPGLGYPGANELCNAIAQHDAERPELSHAGTET